MYDSFDTVKSVLL